MRRTVLIYNPLAGTRKRSSLVAELVSILRTGGVEVDAIPTSAPGDATEIARAAAERGSIDSVLVLGGDGTVREAAKGLLGSPVALAPLAGGTTNVVSRSLALPLDPCKAARALLEASTIECSVGLCGDEPFLMQATLGVDAAVMAGVSSRFKNVAGQTGVWLSGLLTWWSYDYSPILFEADGEAGQATFVAACNIGLYAGAFQLAPNAGYSSQRLELVTFTGSGRLATSRFALNLLLKRHLRMRQVETRPIEELLLSGPIEAPLQLDGDFMRLAPPLRIRTAAERIRLLAPKDHAGQRRHAASLDGRVGDP